MNVAENHNAKPPYGLGEGSPQAIAQQMTRVYRGYEENLQPIVEIWTKAAASVGLKGSSPLFSAGRGLALALDHDEGIGIPHGYHNKGHFVQVLLNATYLTLRNNVLDDTQPRLTSFERGKVLFAALAHDFHYEHGGNKTPDGAPHPCRLEKIAFSNAKPILLRHGLSDTDIRDIGVMIYGTDVTPTSNAGAFVRAAHRYHFEKGPAPIVTDLYERIRPIMHNQGLARMTAIVGDADTLSSAGLTPEFTEAQTIKLGHEWSKPIKNKTESAELVLSFLTNVMENRFTTPEGRFFQPNLDAIREQAIATMARATLTAPHDATRKPKPS